MPGHVLAPNEGSYSNHFGNKVKRKSQLEVQQQTRMSHHHCCWVVEAVIMIKLLFAIFYKSELPIVLQHQNDIMQT